MDIGKRASLAIHNALIMTANKMELPEKEDAEIRRVSGNLTKALAQRKPVSEDLVLYLEGIYAKYNKVTKASKVRQLLKEGKSIVEISKELNTHYSYVHSIAKKEAQQKKEQSEAYNKIKEEMMSKPAQDPKDYLGKVIGTLYGPSRVEKVDKRKGLVILTELTGGAGEPYAVSIEQFHTIFA